jgi:CIC family chloride channel protein
MNEALQGSIPLAMIAGLLFLKLLAVTVTLGSGGSGGIFAPSLFLGAMLGALVGKLSEFVFPGQVAPVGAYALVGMGAMVAGATHAPITAILIIFELTGDYEIMLPLMTSCIIATLLAMRLNKESIYTLKLVRRGVNIRAGRDTRLLENVPVHEVLKKSAPVVSSGEPLESLLTQFWSGDENCLYVVGDAGELRGIISWNELRPALASSETVGKLIIADDIAATKFPVVSPSDSLESVLTRLDLNYRDEIPVIDEGKLVGAVRIEDIITRYRKEVVKREAAETRDQL